MASSPSASLVREVHAALANNHQLDVDESAVNHARMKIKEYDDRCTSHLSNPYANQDQAYFSGISTALRAASLHEKRLLCGYVRARMDHFIDEWWRYGSQTGAVAAEQQMVQRYSDIINDYSSSFDVQLDLRSHVQPPHRPHKFVNVRGAKEASIFVDGNPTPIYVGKQLAIPIDEIEVLVAQGIVVCVE